MNVPFCRLQGSGVGGNGVGAPNGCLQSVVGVRVQAEVRVQDFVATRGDRAQLRVRICVCVYWRVYVYVCPVKVTGLCDLIQPATCVVYVRLCVCVCACVRAHMCAYVCALVRTCYNQARV